MTDELHHLAAAYALDALDDDERREFEAHYSTCDVCTAEVEEFRQVAAALAEGAGQSAPPPLRDRVMNEIGQTAQLPPIVPVRAPVRSVGDSVGDSATTPVRGGASWSRLGMAMAAAVLLTLGVLGALAIRNDATTTDELVTAPDAVVTSLESSGGEGVLQVVWSPERDQVAVIGSGLDSVSEADAYALWFLLGDTVAPAALFVPDENGDVAVVLDVDDIDGQGWGITVEPAGGSPQPTTPVIFAGVI